MTAIYKHRRGGSNIIPYIKLQNVNYRYPKGGFTIKNITLELSRNEFTAITGPNGSGKTTLGKLIAGIYKPQNGQVLIDGADSRYLSLGQIGGKIGYLFQNPDRQIFAPSVREEISFIPELKGYPPEEVMRNTDELLELFCLRGLEDELPFKLSRGEKQLLALAAILVNHPGYLILDEPTTGLDIERKTMLSRIISKLMDEGLGMAVISHDESFIMSHADRIIKLSGGEITDDSKQKS